MEEDTNYCIACVNNEEKIRELQRVLSTVTQERDLAIETYQSSVLTIERLEEDLQCSEDKKKFDLFKRQFKEMQMQMQSDYTDAIEILESNLQEVRSDLELEVQKRNQKEIELSQLQKKIDEMAKVNEMCSELKSREQALRDRCIALETKCLEYETAAQQVRPIRHLEDEIDRLTDQVRVLEKQRNELQCALEMSQRNAEAVVSQEKEARQKVAEALSLVDTTLFEKQDAINKQILAERECKRLQNELLRIIKDAGVEVAQEVELMKKNYQDQLDVVHNNIKSIQRDREKKIKQLELLQEDYCRLEKELDDTRKKSVSMTKINALCDQLAAVEGKATQFESENRMLHEYLMESQERFESEISKCGVERRFLEKQILKLQSYLDETVDNLDKAVQHSDQLAHHLNQISSELSSERAANETESAELFKQLQITQANGSVAMKNLQKFIGDHNRITAKWKDEYNLLTVRFHERLKELKLEAKMEKKRNKRLIKKLENSQAEYDFNKKGDTPHLNRLSPEAQ